MIESIGSVRTALLSSAFIYAGVLPATTHAQTEESEAEGQPPEISEELSDITPDADRILREMSEYLKKASEFTFHAEVAL